MSGSSLVWRIAEELNTVPVEADAVMRAHAAQWWTLPRSFACVHARDADPWFICWPMPSIFCGLCGVVALEAISACTYCRFPVDPGDGQHVVHEPLNGSLVFLSSAHNACLKEAAK